MAGQVVRLGIVGACGRGASFKNVCDAIADLELVAVCDLNEKLLPSAAERLGAANAYTCYDTMLKDAGLDAVVIGTPMQVHAEQAIAALQRSVHVLSEVPAAISIQECRDLVQAAHASSAVYMMAENYTYTRHNALVRELVRQGHFGTPYYAEGEYLHELKDLNETTPWRRTWQTGIAGVTYGTHSLGPILQWMDGDRVARVCCADTSVRHNDPRGQPYAQMTPVMLCQTVRGALIKIRVDMLSNRPHAMNNYSLQGTDGVYESSRGGPDDHGRIWLRSLSEKVQWHNIESLTQMDALAERYMPEIWRKPPEAALKAGHGGGDYFEMEAFIRSIRGEMVCPIGVHEAMDMTLPGLVAQQSASGQGAWLEVPDSRDWVAA